MIMNKPFDLTPWQKMQVTLLYHFASLDYLKGLQKRANDVIALIDPILDLARNQNRDSVLVDKRWGNRDTSENWRNNAWSFLADFQLSIAKDIANRAFEIYGITGCYQCARGMSEYSLQWMTPDEQTKFDAMFEAVHLYAGNIDDTMDKFAHVSRWQDYGLTFAWQEFKDLFPKLPKFRVRTDIESETGKVPLRTGVYIPQDDPHGSLQFAWTGGGRGKLIESATFNDLGLKAFNDIGRKDLWINEDKMLAFVQANKKDPALQNDSFFSDSQTPQLSPSLVARNAFTSRSCKWYFVELVNGEFEDIENEPPMEPQEPNRLRVEGGQPCPQTGYWFTPAQTDSRRYFKEGEKMPTVGTDYGSTIWQWDPGQSA
ncbi:MAG: hypothetical protein JWM42_3834 [Burkholderia sp.]|nr:hypothetical protein [Burkholderia sp.]